MIHDIGQATFLPGLAMAEEAIPSSFASKDLIEVPVGLDRTPISEPEFLRRTLNDQEFRFPHADRFLENLDSLHRRLLAPSKKDEDPDAEAKAMADWKAGNARVLRQLSLSFNWFRTREPAFARGINIAAATAIAESALSIPPTPFVGPSSREDENIREFLRFLVGGESPLSSQDVSALWEEGEELMREDHFYTAAVTFFALAGQAEDPEDKSKGLYQAASALTKAFLAEGSRPTDDHTWAAFHLWQLAITTSRDEDRRDILDIEARIARGRLTQEFQMIESAKRRLEDAAAFNNVQARPDKARESFDDAIDILASAGVVILHD